MYPYQIDVDKRNKPLWSMMGMATLITVALAGWTSTFEIHPLIKNFIPPLSAFFVFRILYWFFDNWLWRWSPLRWAFGISEPNLSGVWRGILKSNPPQNKEIEVAINIKQRWSQISITISFAKSISSSFSAAILCSQTLPVLIYNYANTPHVRESDTMTRHIGTAELTLKDPKNLVGNYFNSGDRKTEGLISVTIE